MPLWSFRDFKDESGTNVIEAWLHGVSEKVRARLDARLAHLENLELANWPKDWLTELSGYPGIFELKFTLNNVQYRPLGCFGPSRREFTLLIGAREIGNRFDPVNAPRTALARKVIIVTNRNRTTEHE